MFHKNLLKNIRVISLLVLAYTLTACAVVPSKITPIHTKDGNAGHIINCSGELRNWAQCYQRASTMCGANGYKQYAKNKGPEQERSLVIACKEAP